jgi:hypothetical protein
VVDSAVVRRDIMGIKEETFLYCCRASAEILFTLWPYTRRLKLVTGVDISTRPVKRSGRPGKENSRRRTAAAAPNRAALRLSTFMIAGKERRD